MSDNIEIKCKDLLQKSRNLLAFSGGVDSSALYHILKSDNIDFDIAIVAYHTRDEAVEELKYAKLLSKKDNKKIYILDVNLKESNFESNAREKRYQFFAEIISTNKYNNLITAHQLNDKLEWFLMQLTKGAGVCELYGFLDISKRDDYQIIRPMIEISRNQIMSYLKQKNIKYFEDISNSDIKHKRNYFRHEFANKLIENYASGINNSFKYLKADIDSMQIPKIYKIEKLTIIDKLDEENINIRYIDKTIKELGVLCSTKQKREILKTKNCVISNKIAIGFNNSRIFICPFISCKLNKPDKEIYRVYKIPTKIRPYITKCNLKEDTISYLKINRIYN
jgi:tRNA(Ile)-lysidine synthase